MAQLEYWQALEDGIQIEENRRRKIKRRKKTRIRTKTKAESAQPENAEPALEAKHN